MELPPELTNLFNAIDSVILRSGNNQLTVMPMIVLEHSQEGGIHRVNIMDALRSAVEEKNVATTDDERQSQPWYSDPRIFQHIAALAVANFNRK